jgi:zinc protease
VRSIARSVLVSACLAVASAAFASAESESAKPIDDPALRTKVSTLANGLTVLTLEDHATPTVSLQVWVEVGSGDESRFTGIAHLFEHMNFLSSKNLARLGPEAYTRLVEERGGRINAFTSRDVTVYFEDVAPEHLPLMIALEGERFANLEVTEEALKAERQVVMEERRLRSESDPEGLAFESLMSLVFQAHPYRIPTVGWQSDLETYYAANNLVLAIAGDFDTAATLALVEKHFGSLRSAATIPRNPQEEPPQDGERRAVEHFPVQAPIVLAGFPAPPTGHVDSDALDVAAGVLANGRTSRLYRKLVFDAPLALAPQAFYWELQHAGVFVAGATLRPGVDVASAERVIYAEIARLAEQPPTPEELGRAKRALEVAWIGGQGTSHALASRIAQDYVAYGRIETLEEKLAAIERVSAEDVQRVVRQYLAPRRRSVVQVFPPAAEEGKP